MTKKAMQISFQAHKDQVDKSGIPYIFHPIHLAEQMETEEAVIVALLHDVVEDTNWSTNELEQEGFSKDIIDALLLLTHSAEIEYLDYIGKIKQSSNQYAKIVKIADLKHNSDISRFDHIDDAISKRIEKYTKAISILTE
jgi:(p)ppGpp synthase/HD superfamily hydrolase